LEYKWAIWLSLHSLGFDQIQKVYLSIFGVFHPSRILVGVPPYGLMCWAQRGWISTPKPSIEVFCVTNYFNNLLPKDGLKW